jgi:mutator protein MutT
MEQNRRAAVVIINKEKLLLIHRKKGDQKYYIFPGGGVKEDETPETAVVREVAEELGLRISQEDLIKFISFEHRSRFETYYFITNYSGQFKFVGDDIANDQRAENEKIYDSMVWIEKGEIDRINLLPERIKSDIKRFWPKND